MFEYSCFVSYRHGCKRLMTHFIGQLVQALEDYIEPWLDLPVFHDRSGLEAGDFHEEVFAHALCHSVCMVAVYTPTYFDRNKTYCVREYRAMEIIESHRLAHATNQALKQKGLIIPIVLKGTLPPYVAARRTCKYDFSRFTLSSEDLSRYEEYVPWFDEIGKSIRSLYETLMSEGELRVPSGFALPGENEVLAILDEVLPFTEQPFPGRNRIDAGKVVASE